jgi:hypothetical protein
MTPEQRRVIEGECTRLSYAFAYHMDHREYEALAALFAPDGVFERHGTQLRGPAEITKALRGRPSDQFTRHVTTNFHFTSIGPEEAGATLVNLSWFSFQAERLPIAFDPSQAILLDFYDRYRLTADGWRFSERITRMVFVAPSLMSRL